MFAFSLLHENSSSHHENLNYQNNIDRFIKIFHSGIMLKSLSSMLSPPVGALCCGCGLRAHVEEVVVVVWGRRWKREVHVYV